MDLDEQTRSRFNYSYSVYQVEYSRNLQFRIGGQMEAIFERMVDRTRSRLDVPVLRTLFGAKARPHRDRKVSSRQEVVLEAIVLALHAAATICLLVHLVGPWPALLVIAVQRTGTGLYLGLVFGTNHQGMPQLTENVKLDYLRRQVLTTRNLRGQWFMDLLHGSLNLQIEHHLFPPMTRMNLRRARPIVKQFCAELAIPYHELWRATESFCASRMPWVSLCANWKVAQRGGLGLSVRSSVAIESPSW